MRVLMVVRLFYPWIGGTERQAHKLALAIHQRNVDVQIVTGRWFRGTRRTELLDGVPVFRNHTLWEFFGVRGLRKLGGYLYIVSLLWHLWRRRDTYDVIHVHGLNYHTFAAVLAGRRLGKPVVTKVANSGPASDIKKMREDRQLALARFMLPTALTCDRFVALNRDVISELTEAGVPTSRIVELPNGVETGLVRRTDYSLHDPARVLYVGRLHAQKGLDTLLHAFASLLAQTDQPCTLRLVGEGPARQQLVTLAGRLGIAQRVDFVGRRDDVARQLEHADVFVLPSRAEGLSNALLEAMACGVPPVVSDIAGNREVVRHRRTGLAVAMDDPAALAAALREALEDRELREELGTAARRSAEQTYGLDGVAERYIALYRSLLAATVPTSVTAVESERTTA